MTVADSTTNPMRPVRERERLVAMDVLRGFALLGIFMVNMILFSMPFAEFVAPANLDKLPPLELLSWAFVKVFCEMKFISLFSLLFGAGLIMLWLRAQQRGSRFVPLYLRRLAVLGVIGLTHGVLLWYGDILFVYACLGFVLLWCRKLSPRVLTLMAVVLLSVMSLLGLGFGAAGLLFSEFFSQLMPSEQSAQTQPATAVPAESGQPAEPSGTQPAATSIEVPATSADIATQRDGDESTDEPFAWVGAVLMNPAGLGDARLVEAETNAFKHGPLSKAIEFRLVWYGFSIAAGVFGYGWHALAMFLIGAALMKWGGFGPERSRWHRRFVVLGLFVGLPFEALNAGLTYYGITRDQWPLLSLAGGAHEIGSTLMCLGFVGLWCLLVSGGHLRRMTEAIANVGRLALSNYLLQTVTSTYLMYWWGLGWFGDVSRVEQIGLVLLIYLGQVIFSTAWLRVFTIGPAEWLWRTLTYMRTQPFLRRNAGLASGAEL